MPFRFLSVSLRRFRHCSCSVKPDPHSPSFSLFQQKVHGFRWSLSLKSRHVTTATENEEFEFQSHPIRDDDLKNRIFRLRFPKRSATAALDKWVGEGKRVTQAELRLIVKELCKSQRYKHALEISEWMRSSQDFDLSDNDYGIHIDLITKVLGVNFAEEYFEGIPLTAKKGETYTALLHSYAAAKLTEKAEGLFEKIKDMSCTTGALPYNEMMTMYMSIGELDKVPLVVEELKKQQVPPDLFTYNLWTSACAATLNIKGVERILDEMSCDSNFKDGWETYVKLAKIYMTTSQLEGSENALVEAEKKITQREWITYDFLIILHAGLGSKERISRIWTSLKTTSHKMTSRNYICILSSYLMLGQVKEAGEVIDEWKKSASVAFDICTCKRLIDAFVRVGLMEKAESLSELLLQRHCSTVDGLDQQ